MTRNTMSREARNNNPYRTAFLTFNFSGNSSAMENLIGLTGIQAIIKRETANAKAGNIILQNSQVGIL